MGFSGLCGKAACASGRLPRDPRQERQAGRERRPPLFCPFPPLPAAFLEARTQARLSVAWNPTAPPLVGGEARLPRWQARGGQGLFRLPGSAAATAHRQERRPPGKGFLPHAAPLFVWRSPGTPLPNSPVGALPTLELWLARAFPQCCPLRVRTPRFHDFPKSPR